jgi:hypothetical protein
MEGAGMAKTKTPTTEAEEARRRQAERLTEQTGEGLIITRLDGTRERVVGGKLVPIEDNRSE